MGGAVPTTFFPLPNLFRATLLPCFEAALVQSYIPIGTFNGIARYLRVFVGRVIRSVWRRSTKDIERWSAARAPT